MKCLNFIAISLFRVPSLVDYIKEPLLYGLSDKIAYVQRIAIIGALKVFHFAPCLIRGIYVDIFAKRTAPSCF